LIKHMAWVRAGAKGDPPDDLRGIDLGGLNFWELSSWTIDFKKATLQGANLQGANLSEVNFQGADLRRANLQGANLLRANLPRSNLQEAILTEAKLQEINLRRANLQGAKLQGADLLRANLQEANLREAVLEFATVKEANLWKADLRETDFQSANLRAADIQRATIQWANLRGANLQEVRFQGANLQGANLQEANLQRTKLQATDLQRAKLQKANLQEADLQGADIRRADFRRANLRLSNLRQTLRFDTRITGREDLVDSIVDDIAGFVFEDETKTQRDRKDRENRAERDYGAIEPGYIIARLPLAYRPAELAQVLMYLAQLYEGVRLAMTAPFGSAEDLQKQAERPDLFGAYDDRYALQIEDIHTSWIEILLRGYKFVTAFIKSMIFHKQMADKFEIENRGVMQKQEIEAAEAEDASYSRKLDIIKKTADIWAEPHLPETIRKLLENEMEGIVSQLGSSRAVARLDHAKERTEAAWKVFIFATNYLQDLRGKRGGEFKVDNEDLLPPEPAPGTRTPDQGEQSQ